MLFALILNSEDCRLNLPRGTSVLFGTKKSRALTANWWTDEGNLCPLTGIQ